MAMAHFHQNYVQFLVINKFFRLNFRAQKIIAYLLILPFHSIIRQVMFHFLYLKVDTCRCSSKTKSPQLSLRSQHKLPSSTSHNNVNLHLLRSFNSLSNKLRPFKHRTFKKQLQKYCLSNETWNYAYIVVTQYSLRTLFNPPTHNQPNF